MLSKYHPEIDKLIICLEAAQFKDYELCAHEFNSIVASPDIESIKEELGALNSQALGVGNFLKKPPGEIAVSSLREKYKKSPKRKYEEYKAETNLLDEEQTEFPLEDESFENNPLIDNPTEVINATFMEHAVEAKQERNLSRIHKHRANRNIQKLKRE